MRSATRHFLRNMPVMAAAASALMLAPPAALANTGTRTLVFAVQPTTTQLKNAMTPPVVVDVKNSKGQLDTSYDGPVTLTYAVNTVGAPELKNTVNAVGGVATFSRFTGDQHGERRAVHRDGAEHGPGRQRPADHHRGYGRV